MFYSHQLLARKAPMGQIWMAATMHAKINRRKLDKLNIIQICEEILNPSVPMALRLSGILMGGVVIVYERKVKLLYEDVTRLLVEINRAWKVKPIQHDPTVLPRGKSQAKYRTVTLPDINEHIEVGEIEQSLHFSNTSSASFHFHQSAYFTMRLDTVEEPLIDDENPREDDPSHQQGYHQAESANITLMDRFDTHQSDSSLFDRFERFDIEGGEDPLMNFTPHEYSQIPTSIRPSPPPPPCKETHQQADEIQDLHPEPQNNQHSDERRSETHQHEQKPAPRRRRTKTRTGNLVMDYNQTIIPGHIYQSWLQNPSDISSRRERKSKPMKPLYIMRKAHLMELPPVALSELSGSASREIHYPGPLLELWMRCTTRQPAQDSPSRGTSFQHPPEPSWSSIPMGHHEQQDLPVQDSHSGVGSQPKQVSVEKQMDNLENIDLPSVNEANWMLTLGSPVGDNERSIPSSASRNGFMPLEPEDQLPSERSNMKRRHSSSRRSGSSLAPVVEESPWDILEPGFKLRRLSENGPSDEPEILIETEPTQTPNPVVAHPIDKTTEAIRKQLKMHFDTPRAPQVESLNQLAYGMNKKKAAQLFYQTCVLASHDFLKVEQNVPYGDILISKGSKM